MIVNSFLLAIFLETLNNGVVFV